MTRYRRSHVMGGTYFFTVITHKRRPFLTTDLGRSCLHAALATTREDWPFTIVALVLLPDHFHLIMSLGQGEGRYSLRLKRVKELFTRSYLAGGGGETTQSPSRIRQGQRGVWQKRFWEHTCRDEDDLKRCVDYVHWNPVKHGLVADVAAWPWSTFHRFAEAGEYEPGWGREDPTPGYDAPEWSDSAE